MAQRRGGWQRPRPPPAAAAHSWRQTLAAAATAAMHGWHLRGPAIARLTPTARAELMQAAQLEVPSRHYSASRTEDGAGVNACMTSSEVRAGIPKPQSSSSRRSRGPCRRYTSGHSLQQDEDEEDKQHTAGVQARWHDAGRWGRKWSQPPPLTASVAKGAAALQLALHTQKWHAAAQPPATASRSPVLTC